MVLRKKMMTEDKGNILAVLLDVKERNSIEIDEKLIKQCYELHEKHQYDLNRSTVDKMRQLIEDNIKNND